MSRRWRTEEPLWVSAIPRSIISASARAIAGHSTTSREVDNRRATLRPDYIQQTQAWYDAELADLDFSHPSAATRINNWASKETHGKIPKVIDRIGPADLAVLLNAVYLKGRWAQKFDKAQTQQRDFARREHLHFLGASIDLLESGRGRLRSRGRYDDRYYDQISRPTGATVSDDRRSAFCAIEDRRSGLLLFVGAIYDPAA